MRPEFLGDLLIQPSPLSVFSQSSFDPQWDQSFQGTSGSKPHLCLSFVSPALLPKWEQEPLKAADSFYLKQVIQECWLFNFSLVIPKILILIYHNTKIYICLAYICPRDDDNVYGTFEWSFNVWFVRSFFKKKFYRHCIYGRVLNKIEILPIDVILEVLGFTTFSIYLVFQF